MKILLEHWRAASCSFREFALLLFWGTLIQLAILLALHLGDGEEGLFTLGAFLVLSHSAMAWIAFLQDRRQRAEYPGQQEGTEST